MRTHVILSAAVTAIAAANGFLAGVHVANNSAILLGVAIAGVAVMIGSSAMVTMAASRRSRS